ncbi:MAG: hypothetical protein KatS3mg085_591 [Candidatus Dojkabacteria bacterium]|nr:MAG: hypothetical protein KatS3mg085_591 [Candidatus Dojkabacteria bacterium]
MLNRPIVSLKNVHKIFKVKSADVHIIKGVSLDIFKGEFVGLVGPSGSGKSTLLNMILGLEEITSGEVELLGQPVKPEFADRVSEIRRRKIGIIYQQPIWIRSLTVLENVAFPLLLEGFNRKVALREATEALATTGMLKWKKYYPQDLSVGQQQRVALARALVNNPDIIFADEPTGNLDIRNSEALVKMLHNLTKENKTVVMITHNLDNLDDVDRIVQLVDGQIVDDIKVSDLNVEQLTDEHLAKIFFENEKKFKRKTEELSIPTTSEKSKQNINLVRSLKNFFSSNLNFILSLTSILMGIFLSYLFTILVQLKLIFKKNDLSFSDEEKRLSNKNPLAFLFHPRGSIDGITYKQLLSISIKNLLGKKLRTSVTVGGISLGIAFTVLLVSLGFGIERLVISNIASLNQIKQIDIYPSVNTQLELTLEDLETLKQVEQIETYYPIISLASKVRYLGSDVDVVGYGVTDEYLQNSDLNVVRGSFFKNSPNSIILNKSLLDIIDPNNTLNIGDEVELSVRSTADLNTDIISDYEKFVVSGIILDTENPIVYLPIENFQKLGISNFTEARISVYSEDDVENVRTLIESKGYATRSVLDTINEIRSIFNTSRIVLGGVGIVGLIIAAFGMFNTLTVSLLERTREVALMKAIGMLPPEVRALFFTESVTMGVMGGVLGLFLSYFAGFLVSLLYSFLSTSEGSFNFTDLTYTPLFFVILILLGSAIIGILTGIYPSKRAEKISSVYALRYE